MSDDDYKGSNLPALTKQVGELVLAGSLEHAEEVFSKAAEEHGDPGCDGPGAERKRSHATEPYSTRRGLARALS